MTSFNLINVREHVNALEEWIVLYPVNKGYFTFGERVRFLFTSCVKQAKERGEWVCFAQSVNNNRSSELTLE